MSPGQPNSSSMKDRARAVAEETGGAVMSVVIRGNGSVRGPLERCQSFSDSISMPNSERSKKMPSQSLHWVIETPPRTFAAMVP
jgi:hypothetical protein